jgi:hypothetical protein
MYLIVPSPQPHLLKSKGVIQLQGRLVGGPHFQQHCLGAGIPAATAVGVEAGMQA